MLLKDIEEYIYNSELICDEVIVEEDSDYRIIAYSYVVYVQELDVALASGIYENWSEDTGDFEADFALTLVYKGFDSSLSEKWDYWEQDDFIITLANYFRGKYSPDELAEMKCEIIM